MRKKSGRRLPRRRICVRDVWLHAAPPDPFDPDFNRGMNSVAEWPSTPRGSSRAEGHASRPRNASSDRDMEKLVTDRWAQYGLGPERSR